MLAVAIAGASFTVLNITSLILSLGPLVDIEDDALRTLVQAEAYLMLDDAGWFLLGASGVAAGVMIVVASLAMR